MPDLGPSPLATGQDQLSVADARAAIHAALRPISGAESVPLLRALGRVLAADVVSPINVPAHDNSAMDGYAFSGALLAAGMPLDLPVAGTVYAGRPFEGLLAEGECLRIMTGTVMPAGLDTVVPQELCSVCAGRVQIAPGVVKPGENRRHRGEDLVRGKAALLAGRVLRPADLGLIASLGR